MPRKRGKRAKKKRKLPVNKPREQQGLRIAPQPLNGMDRATLQAALAERGRTAEAQLPAALERLLTSLRTVDPWSVVATVGFYGTLQGVGPEGPTGKTFVGNIEQHHVELLAALALTVPDTELSGGLPTPDVVQAAFEDIVVLADAFAWARLGKGDERPNEEGFALASLQELLRLHTQVVRNWGYAHQVLHISAELYGSVDAELEQAIGVKATDVVTVIGAMAQLFEQRASERFQALTTVITAATPDDMVRAYYAAFPGVKGSPEDLSSVFASRSREEVASILLSHSELSLPDIVSFEADGLATKALIPKARVQAVLERLSLLPGALSDADPGHFFMANPVWSRPGIRFESSYLFPIPQMGMSHIHRILRRVIEEAGIKPIYERRRADYLEAKIGELLKRAFPTAKVDPSVEWTLDGTRYETDWLVVLDRTVLIVEAKSAALTEEALRGASGRVKRHIADLIIDPALQSHRLEDIIRRARQGEADAQRVVSEVGLDVASIDTVIRLSVTLDDLSMIATAEEELRTLGWLPPDLSLPATLHLADFETVIDILEQPALVLHYLAERSRFQRSTSVLGDELDLLGVYLQSLFNIPQLNAGRTRFVASGESKPIDEYYNRLQAGMPAIKPAPAIAPQMLAVLQYLHERRPPGWITISLDLLSIGNRHQQAALWKDLEKLRKRVPVTQKDPKHDCAMIALTQNGAAVVALYVFTADALPHRFDRIEQLASEQLDASGRQRMTVIGKQVEHWSEPYRFAAVAYAPRSIPA